MFKWTLSLLDRAFSIVGAVAFAQFPQFLQQYVQRMGGHISELEGQVGFMSKSAEASSLTLQEYIQKFTESKLDPVFSRQGMIMQNMVDRYNQLSSALNSLQDATIYKKPLIFITHLSTDIAHETWNTYQPGVPTTLEGLAYAAVGMIFGTLTFLLLKFIIKSIFRKIFPKKQKMVPANPTA
jgi:hypothetical protein